MQIFSLYSSLFISYVDKFDNIINFDVCVWFNVIRKLEILSHSANKSLGCKITLTLILIWKWLRFTRCFKSFRCKYSSFDEKSEFYRGEECTKQKEKGNAENERYKFASKQTNQPNETQKKNTRKNDLKRCNENELYAFIYCKAATVYSFGSFSSSRILFIFFSYSSCFIIVVVVVVALYLS